MNISEIRSTSKVQQSLSRTKRRLKDHRDNGIYFQKLIRQSLTVKCLSWCKSYDSTAADIPKAVLSVGFQALSTVQIAERNCITV